MKISNVRIEADTRKNAGYLRGEYHVPIAQQRIHRVCWRPPRAFDEAMRPITFDELAKNTWWRENKTSLILAPDPIIEDVEIRKLKKKSLELAGIV